MADIQGSLGEAEDGQSTEHSDGQTGAKSGDQSGDQSGDHPSTELQCLLGTNTEPSTLMPGELAGANLSPDMLETDNGNAKTNRDTGRRSPKKCVIADSTSGRSEQLLILDFNSTTMHIDWSRYSNNEGVHGYKIKYSIKDNSSYNEIFLTPGISNYTISGLKPGTDYSVSVNAIDRHEKVIGSCGNGVQRTSAYNEHGWERSDVPYITAMVAITLLLVAAIVPVTFLFIHSCGHRAGSTNHGQIQSRVT